jgi:hypothetical protein
MSKTPQPSTYIFSGEQWNAKSLAFWIQEYDNPTYLAWGGSNAPFTPSANYQPYAPGTYGNVAGQVTGPLELQQFQAVMPVATYIITHPTQTVAEEKKLGLGFQSPNDPTYFVPYYSPEKDATYVSAAISNGVPFNAIISSLTNAAYTPQAAVDTICMICSNYFQSIIGPGNYTAPNYIPGFAYDFQVLEPIFGINPYTQAQQQAIAAQDASWTMSPTGTLTQTSSTWANHIGGETVNLCFPFNDKNTQSVASLIHTALLTYYDSQAGAILYGINNNFDNILATALPDVSSRLYAYCQQVTQQTGVPYSFVDLFSPTPFTPSQKQYLSQSQYYNPVSIHEPTYGAAFAAVILSGTSPWIPNGGQQSTYEKEVSYYGIDLQNFIPLVTASWAHTLNLWIQQSKLPVIPEISLLQPFATLYDPQ